MAIFYNFNKIKKIMFGTNKIKKGFYMENKIYSSGNAVTYMVDTGVIYTEEIDEGASVLSPSSVPTPSKTGWEFIGWRKSDAATGNVLTSEVMNDSPITLYAVFGQEITVTTYNGSTYPTTHKRWRYYNNGNITNPTYNIAQATKDEWSARGWSTGTSGNSEITYGNGTDFTRSFDITLYGMYQQTITLSYSGNGNTSGSISAQSGIRYYNSNGNTTNPTFTLATNSFVKTGYTFSKWALGSTTGTQYTAGTTITLSSSTTMYAIWTSTSYYAIQNGVLQRSNAPGAYAWSGGYSNGSGDSITGPDSTKYYGGFGHTNGGSDSWGANTGDLSTNGCKYLNIIAYAYLWGDDSGTPKLQIFGDGVSIKDTYVPDGKLNTTIDISKYNKVRAYISYTEREDKDNSWINVGFNEVRLYS